MSSSNPDSLKTTPTPTSTTQSQDNDCYSFLFSLTLVAKEYAEKFYKYVEDQHAEIMKEQAMPGPWSQFDKLVKEKEEKEKTESEEKESEVKAVDSVKASETVLTIKKGSEEVQVVSSKVQVVNSTEIKQEGEAVAGA